MDAVSFLCCLVALTCWGLAPVAYRYCGSAFSPLKMQALRSVGFFASAAAALAFLPRVSLWPGWLPFAVLIGTSLLTFLVGDTLYFKCIATIGAGKAAALTNTYPVYVVALSWLFMDEGLSGPGLLGVLVIAVGMALLCLFKDTSGAASDGGDQPVSAGLLTGIVAGICWGIGQAAVRWTFLNSSLGPAEVTFWRAAAVIFSSLPQYAAARRRQTEQAPFFGPDRARAAVMIFTGFFVLTLPGWLVASAMQRVPAAVVSPLTGSSPMVAALFSALLFREKIAPMQWLGIFMIIGGGAMVSLL